MHINVGYPDEASEAAIMRLVRGEEIAAQGDGKRKLRNASTAGVFEARKEIGAVTVWDSVEKYIVALVFATRYPDRYDKDSARLLQVGVSPCGVIGLDKVSRSYAWLKGRAQVTPGDVIAIVHDFFRHRAKVWRARSRDLAKSGAPSAGQSSSPLPKLKGEQIWPVPFPCAMSTEVERGAQVRPLLIKSAPGGNSL
jgi:MoxR-like ATPase